MSPPTRPAQDSGPSPQGATAPMWTQPPSAPPAPPGNWEGPAAASATLPNQSRALVPWTTGLCDCFDDVCNCFVTCLCPCITFGQIAEIVDRGSSSCGGCGTLYALILCLTGCPCLYSCFYRTRLRNQYSLVGGSCGDFSVHCCCEHCALCQEYRELKNRGFDMHIGWQAHMERQAHGGDVALAPAAQRGMTR